MPTVSRIAILCFPILLLMVILQFDLLLLREHSPSLVPLIPTLRTSHPEVTLSDPGGPLLVSMAEVVMLPPHVLPHPTCSPPPLPRLKNFSSKTIFGNQKKILSRFPNCSGSPGLTGQRLSSPRSVVMMMLFGFEVTMLVVCHCAVGLSGHFSG